MIKQTVVIYVSLAVAAISLAQTNDGIETPQECIPDSPNYNATICSEKCTNELYKNSSFCLRNVTINAPTTVISDTQTSQQTPEVTPSVTSTSEKTTTVVQNVNVSNETTNNNNTSSSGMSVKFSTVFIGSCFLLLYFVL